MDLPADILKTWKVAALTAPFVLVTWTMLLASYAFGGLENITGYALGLVRPKKIPWANGWRGEFRYMLLVAQVQMVRSKGMASTPAQNPNGK